MTTVLTSVAEAALAAERERSRVLAEALAPFAISYDNSWSPDASAGHEYPEDWPIDQDEEILVGHLRRAATAVRRYKDGEKAEAANP